MVTVLLCVWLGVGLGVYVLGLRAEWTLVVDAAHWHSQGRKHPRRDFCKGAVRMAHAVVTWPGLALWLLIKELL